MPGKNYFWINVLGIKKDIYFCSRFQSERSLEKILRTNKSRVNNRI